MASINKISEIFAVLYSKYTAIFQAPGFVQKSILYTCPPSLVKIRADTATYV
jgi:hypothetical protein